MDMREQKLNQIRALAAANGGQAPGVRIFENKTGIRQSAWRGIYWARWNDAVREAGCEPNAKQGRLEEEFILKKLAAASRHFGRFPTATELRMYSRMDPAFPNEKTITKHFGSLRDIPSRLRDWASSHSEYHDLVELLGEQSSSGAVKEGPVAISKEGLVYLIRSGSFYKIGRSEELERRVKEIRVALPEAASLVHAIRTDDPSGIEAYWHRRFADRRANGEWFKLTALEVSAFKRRRYQ